MIAINGLGRIGRLAVRSLAKSHPGLVCALNDPAGLRTLVHLLRYDSVHGRSELAIEGIQRDGQDYIVLEGRELPLFHAKDPAEIPFPDFGVRIVAEASGHFTSREAAARHLKGSVSHVVISAPSPDPDITLIAPVNGSQLDLSRHHVIANASCTAHATAPMLEVLNRSFGVETAGMSTVHVSTNNQNLLDGVHRDPRRARAAFQNIIPTTTTALEPLKRTLPWLPADFDGLALRVPTLSVNLVDLGAVLRADTDVAALRAAYEEAASTYMKGILAIAEDGAVSSDITGRKESVVMDLGLTQVMGGRFVKVFGWHDNEVGYAARLVDLLLRMAGELATGSGPGQA